MSKRQLFATANVCLAALPPLVGIYDLSKEVALVLPLDPERSFLLGFVLGFGFVVPGILFAISMSPGEQQ